jgi:hypothetical protein
LPDGTPPRSSVSPDLLHLLKLMSMRSKVVDARLSGSGLASGAAIMEIGSGAPSILDRLVEARVRVEAPRPPELEASPPEPKAHSIELEDADADLLDMVASEAGQPPAADPSPLALIEELPAPDVETSLEPDELVAIESLETPVVEVDELVVFERDEAAEPSNTSQVSEGDELASAGPYSAPPQDLEGVDGPGEDFQALLSGARVSAQPDASSMRAGVDEDMASLLPASADVRLRARNGPKPGAEFSGKSTLAGAGGVYCLIEHFDLPAGTRMKLTLSASPRLDDQVEVQDAVVTRVRKAPGDAEEVQLGFDEPHPEVEQFVDRHFSDKPAGFSLFGRRRNKR